METSMVLSPTVYVLELEQGNYYVGITYSLNVRLAQHWSGSGAKWTRLHRPIRVVEVLYPATVLDENETTKKYMEQYGYDRVRGGVYNKPNMKYVP